MIAGYQNELIGVTYVWNRRCSSTTRCSRNISWGIRRLEYRGYDSAGVAIVDTESSLTRIRRLGKVQELADAVNEAKVVGGTGIAHTRWATHGEPSEINAHPHMSGDITVVHNGIIENHEELRELLKSRGYQFESESGY